MSSIHSQPPHDREPCQVLYQSAGVPRETQIVRLVWQPGFSTSRKPFKKVRRLRVSGKKAIPGSTQQYNFIQEDPRPSADGLCDQHAHKTPLVQSARSNAESGGLLSKTTDLTTVEPANIVSTIPEGIRFRSLALRFDPMFQRYDAEFCVIPLTTSMCINPFQCERGSWMTSPSLMHAVLALAGHHLNIPAADEHHQAAMCAVRRGLDAQFEAAKWLNLVHTIIVLFSLEESRSALGYWNVHLAGALHVLEAVGEHAWLTSPRTVAQVGIFTWWDATASLLARQSPIFPYSYFQATLQYQGNHSWDLFSLCGCPQSLAVAAVQLAHLAAQKAKASAMQSDALTDSLVFQLEQSLEAWHHVSPPEAWINEESLQQDADRRHCSEAWRYGLLLYIYRIFRWRRGQPTPTQILHYARMVADHVFSCRDTGYLAKQAALPLFWAGCELTDPSLRKRIADFCIFWSNKSGYRLLDDVVPLLKKVWRAQEVQGLENVCWTSIIDEIHALEESGDALPRTICFG